MSGSPIIADDGSAIGLVSVSGDDRRRYAYCTGPQLCRNLPRWLLREHRREGLLPALQYLQRSGPNHVWRKKVGATRGRSPLAPST